jgi:imidazolonepropionase
MLIHSASELLTLAGGPQRGAALGTLGIIKDGAVLVRDGKIAAFGTTADLRSAHGRETMLDAGGRVVMPGFVDPHTHVIWAGDRANEFEMRLQGAKYMDILAAGGGIISTVRKTRGASVQELVQETRPRLERMFAHGTTTIEAKTGYGLELATELRMLEALLQLERETPADIAITFLAAHAIAPEYANDPQGYTDLVCTDMLPKAKDWWNANAGSRPLPFVDVFCEDKAFNLKQSRQILERARALGFPLKIHADEFGNLGGASLAVELGATSADHLVKTSEADIEALGRSRKTVAVALPCTPFGLAEEEYTPAKAILAAGGLLALATDCNPGTAWNESMQFAMALACRKMGLTPSQAIAAATINAAAAIGREMSIGSLEVGKQADMLVLDAADHRQLGYRFGGNLVRTVIKRGRVYAVDGGFHQVA